MVSNMLVTHLRQDGMLDEENRLECAPLGQEVQTFAIEGKKFIESCTVPKK